MPAASPDRRVSRVTSGSVGIFLIRYGLGTFFVVLGLVLLVVSPGGFGVDGFGLSAGAGCSVLMVNILFRLGVSGDREREQEEWARRFLAEHGRWPNDAEREEALAQQRARVAAGERPGTATAADWTVPAPVREEPEHEEPEQPAGRQPAGHDHHAIKPPSAEEHGSRRTGLSRDFQRRRRRG
jgi:hypothetical protein